MIFIPFDRSFTTFRRYFINIFKDINVLNLSSINIILIGTCSIDQM